MCAFLRAVAVRCTFDGLMLCRSKRKLYLCERWSFQPAQRVLFGPAAYELPPLTLAWHPDLVKIVAVSIPPKDQAPPVLTVLLPGGLDQHQVLLLGGLGVEERKIPRCLQRDAIFACRHLVVVGGEAKGNVDSYRLSLGCRRSRQRRAERKRQSCAGKNGRYTEHGEPPG